MKRKVLITLSLIIVIVIGIIYFSNLQVSNEEIDDIDVETFFETPQLDDNISELENLKLDEEFEVPIMPEEIIKETKENKHSKLNIFKELNVDELLKEVPNTKRTSPMSAVEIPQNSISQLRIGEIIQLPTIGQIEYSAKITDRTVHKNGSVSVSGDLEGEGNANFSVVLTEGKNSSFASITTPEGTFQIETVNGRGYIYSVNEIERNYIDPNKEDVLISDGGSDEHHHNHKH